MASNPKIEFYRFSLKPKKKNDPSTFKDFIVKELGGRETQGAKTLFKLLFSRFEDCMSKVEYNDDAKLSKKIEIVKSVKHNLHLSRKPVADDSSFIISGVINGGPYGRDRLVADKKNETIENLGQNKIVYLYYYIFLYCPLDYNEGVFGVHSNSIEESVTQLFRGFVSKFFSGTHFNNPEVTHYAPKSFQKDFVDDAFIQKIVFEETSLSPDFSGQVQGLIKLPSLFDIKITVTPKDGAVSLQDAQELSDRLSGLVFGEQELGSFPVKKIITRKDGSRNTKTFELNTRDQEFAPVIYLNDYIIQKNVDGTPNFDELNSYIHKLFKEEILTEIRPDNND